MRTRRSVHDRGESLIELLVAVIIMGTAVVAIVGGLGSAIMMTDVNRKQAAVAAYLKIFAANLESAIAATPTQYIDCATEPPGPTPGSYPGYAPGAPYDAEIVPPVLYWNAPTSSFVTSCAGGDTGVQRVRLRVWSTDGRADQTVDLIIRKPCRPADPPCG
jgi:type II secretory pathway pseudopilin PulG